jgi:hypothetical protein
MTTAEDTEYTTTVTLRCLVHHRPSMTTAEAAQVALSKLEYRHADDPGYITDIELVHASTG